MQKFKSFSALLFSVVSSSIVLTNCTSNEIANSKDVNQDKIYQGYHVTYNEGNAVAEVTGTFRFGGSNGTTLVLSNPSNVKVDGLQAKVDSGWGSGAFYRSSIQSANFVGPHEIVFTNTENKSFTNSFTVESFKVTDAPVVATKTDSLVLHFETPNLQASDYVEVASSKTDSSFRYSFYGNDANKYITIPASDLLRQKNNSVTMDITLNKERKLTNITSEGGIITIRHSLKPLEIRLASTKR